MGLPVITQQPVDAIGWARRIGADFSVAATTDEGPLTYQWYFADGDVAILGAVNADLNFTPKYSQTGKGTYCVVSNDAGPVQSDTAFLSSVLNPDVGLINPELADYMTSPWVAINGGSTWRPSTAYNHFTHRGLFAGGAADAYSEYTQLVPVNLNHDILLASWSLRGFADPDDAETYYQFFQANGTTATGAKVKWNGGPPPNTDATAYREAFIPKASIPVDAFYVKITIVHDRNQGTSNNCAIAYCAVIQDPDNFESTEGLKNYDQLWEYVYGLLTMDGVNGATSVVNDGHDPSTWNFTGTCQLSNAETLFGSATVARMNGDGALVSTDTSYWPGQQFGGQPTTLNKNQTLEVWLKPDVGSLGVQRGVFFLGSVTSNTNRVQCIINANKTVSLYHDYSASGQTIVTTTNLVIEDEWNFIRVNYGNPSQIQLNDGEPISYRITSSNTNISIPIGDGFRLGECRASNAQIYFLGYMGPVRLTGAFRNPRKIPIPDRSFPTNHVDELYDDLVLSHIIGTEANGSTTIVDNKGLTWTPTNAAYTSAVQHFGGNTLQLSNGYIETSGLPELKLGHFDQGFLHISMWVNWDGVSLTPLFFMGNPGTDAGRMQSRINADGTIQVYGANAAGTVSFNLNTTYALAAAGWNYVEIKVSGRRVWVRGNCAFMGEAMQTVASVVMSYATPTVARMGYSQASATGQNATAEFMDFRLTYGGALIDTAGRNIQTDNPALIPPLTYLATVADVPTDGPTITTQPLSQSVEDQQTALFFVAATSSGGPLTYQWYSDGGVIIVGATTDTYEPLADWDTNNGEEYYCIVGDNNGSTESSHAFLTVTKIPLVFTQQPAPQIVDDQSNASFMVAVTGRPPFGYQWQNDIDGILAGETADTLSFTADIADDGKLYSCLVLDYYMDVSVPSNTALLTVNEIPLVLNGPFDENLVDEDITSFTVTEVTGRGPFTYQWYQVSSGLLPGEVANLLAFQVALADDGEQFYCDVTDYYANTVSSVTADLGVVKIPVVFTVQPQDESVYDWNPVEFTVAATSKLPQLWQWYENDILMPGEVATTLDIAAAPPSSDGYEYHAELTDGYLDVTDSATAILTVDELPIETTIDVRVLDPDGIWVSIVGPQGEPGQAGDLIDDTVTSLVLTWSSSNLFDQLALKLNTSDLPHDLYSPVHTDVDTNNPLTENNVLRWDIATGKFIPDYATFWRGAWVDGQYFRGDQVEAAGWLMTCNALLGTYEPAEPQITGPETFIYPTSPTWATSQDSGLLTMQMTITMDGNLCQQFRVWPSTVGLGVNHLFEVIIRRAGPEAIPVSKLYYNPIMTAGQWNVLQFADAPLPRGTIIDVFMHVIDETSTTTIGPYEWNFAGVNAEPLAGQWSRSGDHQTLRISSEDANGFDRSLELSGVDAGSRGTFEQQNDPERFSDYLAITPAVEVVSGTNYYEWEARRTRFGGSIQQGALCDVTGTVPVPQNTDYVEILDYFPAGDPDWGTVQSTFLIDGVDQLRDPDTGYGLDIGAAPGVISEFWDYNNYSDVSPNPAPTAREQEFLSKYSGEYRGNRVVFTTTTNWQALESFDIPLDTCHNVEIMVIGQRTDAGFAYGKIRLSGLIWNDAGTAYDDVPKISMSATVNGLDARVTTVGTVATLEVRGRTGQTWEWTDYYYRRDIT